MRASVKSLPQRGREEKSYLSRGFPSRSPAYRLRDFSSPKNIQYIIKMFKKKAVKTNYLYAEVDEPLVRVASAAVGRYRLILQVYVVIVVFFCLLDYLLVLLDDLFGLLELYWVD